MPTPTATVTPQPSPIQQSDTTGPPTPTPTPTPTRPPSPSLVPIPTLPVEFGVGFKGKVKFVRPGTFSVACVTTGGSFNDASCRLRVIVGSGQVIGLASEPVNASGAARLRITLKGSKLKAARKAKTVKFALDLVAPDGTVLDSTRSNLTRPFED